MNAVEDRIKELEESVKVSPGSPAFARLADHYRAMGHVDDAIALCENGIKHNPGYATGHLLLGRCYYEKVRVDDAVVEFETVLKLDRKNIFTLKIMGDIAAQKGKRKEAAAFYRKAADYDPRNAGLQELFKRFEKYHQEPAGDVSGHPDSSPAAGITGAVRDRIADTEMVERDTGLNNRDSTDSRILSSAKGVHEEILEPPAPVAETPAADAAVDAALSFDDLDKAAEATENRVAEETAPLPADIPGEPPSEAPPAAPAETTELRIEDLSAPVFETGSQAVSPTAEVPEAVEVPEQAVVLEETPVPEEDANASPGTEMVDLPPEMTRVREERVGDFKVRKSLLDRLMDEQNTLFETATGPEETAPSGDSPEPPAGPAPSDSGLSSFAPGMDGYYNVQGEEGGESQGDAQLAGIDDVEMHEGIDEEAVASGLPSAPPAEPEPPPAPVSPIPSILEEVSLPREAVPEAEPPALPEEAADDHGVSFNDLLQDMDADDEIKRFVLNLKEEETAPSSTEAPLPTDAGTAVPAAPVVTEEIESPFVSSSVQREADPPPGEADISPSAAGMAGFYNVTGETASEGDSLAIAGEIDQVEIDGALSEEAIALDGAPEAADADAGGASGPLEVELGEDVEFDIPAIPGAATAAASDLSDTPAAPPKEPARKKNEKGKTRSTPRVVSNLATASLGDIYLRQGHKEQALAVFQKILAQDSGNEEIRKKVEKIEKEIENES